MSGPITNGGCISFISVDTESLKIKGVPIVPALLLAQGEFTNSNISVNASGQISAITNGVAPVPPVPVPPVPVNPTCYTISSVDTSVLDPTNMLLFYHNLINLVSDTTSVYNITLSGIGTSSYSIPICYFTVKCQCCYNATRGFSFFIFDTLQDPATGILNTDAVFATQYRMMRFYYNPNNSNSGNAYCAELTLTLDPTANTLAVYFNGDITHEANSINDNLACQLTSMTTIIEVGNCVGAGTAGIFTSTP